MYFPGHLNNLNTVGLSSYICQILSQFLGFGGAGFMCLFFGWLFLPPGAKSFGKLH